MVTGEHISRLMDGELDGPEADAAYLELKQEDGVLTWVCYHVIGDSLRRTRGPTPGFAARFARRLEAETTVLAPPPRHAARLPFVWAAAATIAAITVVAWVAVSTLEPTTMANAREAATVRSAQVMAQPISPDYLLAHQEYSPTIQIQGVGPYLRSVSAASADARP